MRRLTDQSHFTNSEKSTWIPSHNSLWCVVKHRNQTTYVAYVDFVMHLHSIMYASYLGILEGSIRIFSSTDDSSSDNWRSQNVWSTLQTLLWDNRKWWNLKIFLINATLNGFYKKMIIWNEGKKWNIFFTFIC